jgi:hypothetical protein
VTSAARSFPLDVLPAESAPAGDYLGPAAVLDVRPGAVQVELRGGTVVTARMALAFPYEPAPGDTLLVIGKGADHYVIGVLHGSGRTSLTMVGDVELRASEGVLRLSGDRGVELRGPEVEISASKLRVVAAAALQRFTSLCQRVTDLLSVQAGEAHTVVHGSQLTQAKNATMLTEEIMTINGKQIHLG